MNRNETKIKHNICRKILRVIQGVSKIPGQNSDVDSPHQNTNVHITSCPQTRGFRGTARMSAHPQLLTVLPVGTIEDAGVGSSKSK